MHLTELELNDYADGLLEAVAAARLEEHIAECATCAIELQRINDLQASLRALPRTIEPPRDLRAGMWDRIDAAALVKFTYTQTPIHPNTHTPINSYSHTQRLRLATAAVLLIAASSAITLAIVKKQPSPPYAGQLNRALVSNNARSLELQYNGELEQLHAILQKSQGRLAPETVRILADNLAIIDNAIGEARTALLADPNSSMLVDLLRSAYERKVELLRQAAKSSSST